MPGNYRPIRGKFLEARAFALARASLRGLSPIVQSSVPRWPARLAAAIMFARLAAENLSRLFIPSLGLRLLADFK